jgi:hypothetical protein
MIGRLINGRIMKPVRAGTAGWQITCWKLAEDRKTFAVEGFSDRHQNFGRYLCSSFGYHIKRGGEKAVFTPFDAR